MRICPTRQEFVRFLVLGPLGIGIFWSALFLLTECFGVWYANSVLIGFAINTVFYFFPYKSWVFQNAGNEQLRWQMEMFVLIRLAFFNANIYLLQHAVELWRIPYIEAQFFLTVVLGALNFIALKFLFRNSETVQTARIQPSCTA